METLIVFFALIVTTLFGITLYFLFRAQYQLDSTLSSLISTHQLPWILMEKKVDTGFIYLLITADKEHRVVAKFDKRKDAEEVLRITTRLSRD